MKKILLLTLFLTGCVRPAVRDFDPALLTRSIALRPAGIALCDTRPGHFYQVTFYETSVRLADEDFSFRGMTTYARSGVQDDGNPPEPKQQLELFFFSNGGVVYNTYLLGKSDSVHRDLTGINWNNWSSKPTFGERLTYRGYISARNPGNTAFSILLTGKKYPLTLVCSRDGSAIIIQKIIFHKEIETQGSPYTEVLADRVFDWGRLSNSEEPAKLYLKTQPVLARDSSTVLRNRFLKQKKQQPVTKEQVLFMP